MTAGFRRVTNRPLQTEPRGFNQRMPKLRVYQLARELNRDNAEIIRELQHMGVPVTSHSNTVEDRLADRLRRDLGVFVPDGGKKASSGNDDIVAVDIPDMEEPAAIVAEAA